MQVIISLINCSSRVELELECLFSPSFRSIFFYHPAAFTNGLWEALLGLLSACWFKVPCQWLAFSYISSLLPSTNFCFAFWWLFNRPLQSVVAKKNKSHWILQLSSGLMVSPLPHSPKSDLQQKFLIHKPEKYFADSRTQTRKLQDKPGTSCCARI